MDRVIVSLLLYVVFMYDVFGAMICVPHDYKSIQEAIDAAKPNDEVVVSIGTYNLDNYLNINKKITLRSTYDGRDWDIVKSTIIKGGKSGSYVMISAISAAEGVVIRGLTFTQDVQSTTALNIIKGGITTDGQKATIEYNIIENCVTVGYHGEMGGAAIDNIQGTIQNNIFRNNRGDRGVINGCSGLIRNNLFYNDNGAGLGINLGAPTIFTNNTVYCTVAAGGILSGSISNNILWSCGNYNFNIGYDKPPHSCVIKGYKGAGKNIITSDPKFVDPVHGDFRLQVTSPCIDAGVTTEGVKADFNGVQRGLKGYSGTRGDGSGVDIGAFEYIPKPVSVWLPNGGPDKINANDNLVVAWQMDLPTAGTAIILQLYNGSSKIADLGSYWNPNGADQNTVKLPSSIPTRGTYTIRGISSWNHALYSDSLAMTIFGLKNSVNGSIWSCYI